MKLKIPFEEVWNRVKEATDLKTQKQLGAFLGIKHQSITNLKKTDGFLVNWIHRIAQEYELSVDWLVTGKGAMKPGEPLLIQQSINDSTSLSAQFSPIKDKHLESFEEDLKYLHKIYEYGDEGIINSIHNNLITFDRTIIREKQYFETLDQVNDLSAELPEYNKNKAALNIKTNKRGKVA